MEEHTQKTATGSDEDEVHDIGMVGMHIELGGTSSNPLLANFRPRSKSNSSMYDEDQDEATINNSPCLFKFEGERRCRSLSHGGTVLAIAWSPNGSQLAAGGDDQKISVRDVTSGKEIWSHTQDHWVHCIVWSPDGSKIAIGGGNPKLVVRDATNGDTRWSQTQNSVIWSVAWSPCGNKIAVGCGSGCLSIRDAVSGQELHILKHGGALHSVQWSPNGSCIAAGGDDRLVTVRDASTFDETRSFTHAGEVYAIAWSSDSKFIASGGDDRKVTVRDASTGALMQSFSHAGIVLSVAWSPRGLNIAAGGGDEKLTVRDASSGTELLSVAHEGSVVSMAWSPDATQIAAGGSDAKVLVRDVASGEIHQSFTHGGEVNSIVWSPSCTQIASAGSDRKVTVYDATSGAVVRSFAHVGGIFCISWSPDGNQIVTGDSDNKVTVHCIATGTEKWCKTLNGKVLSIAWSPDGAHISSGCDNGEMTLHDASSGDVTTVYEYAGKVHCITWSPDGSQIAAGESTGHIVAYNFAGATEMWSSQHNGEIISIAWSPTEAQIAAGGTLQSIVILDATTGTQLRSFTQSAKLYSITWSPNGEQIAAGGEDEKVTVRDACSGVNVWSLANNDGAQCIARNHWVRAISWSSDGEKIAAGGGDQRVTVYDIVRNAGLLSLSFDETVLVAAWSPCGAYIAVGTADWNLSLHDVTNGITRQSYRCGGEPTCIAWSPDSTMVAWGASNCKMKVQPLRYGHGQVFTFTHEAPITSISWSPDGKNIAAGGHDRKVMVVDAARGTNVHSFSYSNWISSIAWSPNSERIAIGGADCKLTVRALDSGAEILASLQGSIVTSIAWSPDGTMIVVACEDGKLAIYDSTSAFMKWCVTHKGSFLSVAWSRDGAQIAAGSDDKTMRLWAWQEGESLQPASRFTGKDVCWVAFSPDAMCVAYSAGSAVYLTDPHHGKTISPHPKVLVHLCKHFPEAAKRVIRCFPAAPMANDADGNTALHIAVQYDSSVLRHLLELNLDHSADNQRIFSFCPNRGGRTALGLAIDKKYKVTIGYFVDTLIQRCSPMHRIHTVQRDLVKLVKEFPMFATRLLAGIGLESSGAVVEFSNHRAIIGRPIISGSPSHIHSDLIWKLDDSAHVKEPHTVWHTWQKLLSNRDEFVEVEVEAKLVGLMGVCMDRKFLSVLCRTRYMRLFETTVVKVFLQHHWQTRHFKASMLQLGFYVLLLIFFGTWAWRVRTVSRHEELVPLCVLSLLLTLMFVSFEIVQFMHNRSSGKFKTYFRSGWNIVDTMGLSLMLYLTIAWLIAGGNEPPDPQTAALASLLSHFKLLGFLRAFRPLASFVALLAGVVTDALPFMLILIVVMLGFGAAFHSLGEFNSLSSAVYNTFILSMGETFIDESDHFSTLFRKTLQIVCLLFVPVVMMNLLIAIISDSFERAQEKEQAQFLFERANIIRDNNAVLDTFGIWLERPCYWLHVLESKEGMAFHDAAYDDSIKKGIRHHQRQAKEEIQSDLALIKEQIAELHAEIINLRDGGAARGNFSTANNVVLRQ
eukprot:g2115.t1